MIGAEYMYFYIAFDKNSNNEFLLYKDMIHKDKVYYSEPMFKCINMPIGSFFLHFLNIDLLDVGLGNFIRKFCYESLYYEKYPNKKKDGLNFVSLELTEEDYLRNLFQLIDDEWEDFYYIKNVFLKFLKLPYDSSIMNDYEDEYEDDNNNLITTGNVDFLKQFDGYYYNKSKLFDEYLEKIKINNPKLYDEYKNQSSNEMNEDNVTNFLNDINITGLISNLSLEFTFIPYFLCGVNLLNYNIPYCFSTSNIIDIFVIELKEFLTDKRHIIKQCKNCGKYFIPKNLRDIKYCDNIFKDNKTCKQIGKEISYKNSLKEDKLLDMYRKRYLSLASSVSHYGTNKAIARFEKYKKDGAIMKKKYLEKKISGEEFEKWIKNRK